jgi:Rrf2 family iron-sulfur cluster assembly transcriptional regulator
MIFSKSFGYAVRGVLYIARTQKNHRSVQVGEIASGLAVPRHFMAKVLKKLAKEGIIKSTKGPSGGFSTTENTLNTRLLEFVDLANDRDVLDTCVLQFKKCNSKNPCPLHSRMDNIRSDLSKVLHSATIGDLLKGDNVNLIDRISPSPADLSSGTQRNEID